MCFNDKGDAFFDPMTHAPFRGHMVYTTVSFSSTPSFSLRSINSKQLVHRNSSFKYVFELARMLNSTSTGYECLEGRLICCSKVSLSILDLIVSV